ncbi:hypothetical protein [Cyclobacterium xiamenense]
MKMPYPESCPDREKIIREMETAGRDSPKSAFGQVVLTIGTRQVMSI